MTAQPVGNLPTMAELNRLLTPYQKSNTGLAIRQIVNSVGPYVLLWVLAVVAWKISFWLVLPVTVLAALFLIRIFILFHDCGHNSLFPSTRLNRLVGFWLGVLVFTPGEQWWKSHAMHHATSGNLDKRGIGDVETMTLEEYCRAPWPRRLGYRLFRNPLIMFGLGPFWMFLINHRLAMPKLGRKETMSVVKTNLVMLVVAVVLSLLIGWQAYVVIQLLILWFAGMLGIWMFYLQHQYINAYWARTKEWNYVASAMKGASYYSLPRVLEWFTGNIGYHHIHHLSPRIPNYELDHAHKNNPVIQQLAVTIPFSQGWKTVQCKLWDEAQGRMVGFPKRI